MNLNDFTQALNQPRAGDVLTFEFGEELAVDAPIVEVDGDNILLYTDKLGGNIIVNVAEAKYQGKTVKLNKPIRTGTDEPGKFKVYVKDPKTGNVKMVRFGHQGGGKNKDSKTMRIKKSNPARRKSFRARHNCANPGPKTKARYWSCRMW